MESTDSFQDKFELICGVTLAVFAACLAINDLGGGKFGDDELIAYGQGQQAYAWYASKGLKENLAEGQAGLLGSLINAGAVAPDKMEGLRNNIRELEADITRYKKEKKEILVGSAAVGQENWIQDIDGQLGVVIGAKEHEAVARELGRAGDLFDLGTLFLQLSLVIGAISLILKQGGQKKAFYFACVGLGLIGCGYSVAAFLHAFSVA